MTRPLGSVGRPLLFLMCLFGVPGAAWPQVPEVAPAGYGDPPAHVAYVEGSVVLERDGQTDDAPGNMPLLAGDRLRTGSGRAEVLFADGSTLHLDYGTVIDFQSDALVRLLQGRVRLSIPGPSRDANYRIDTPAGSAVILTAGDYRVAVAPRGDHVELAVIRGFAELSTDRGRRELRAGERVFARAGEAPSYPYVFNSAAWDAFDSWSEARRDTRLGLSTRYLPAEVSAYSAAFDQYGSWRYDTTYGYVWYPVVAADWRPYYHGRWVSMRPYGWTWIGAGPWAWPTHHYGRWGVSAGTWFWIPGRQWAPAWVSWAYAPGYVSWCPLGWNNRPIVQFVNVNVHRGYDPWRAWTVVPRQHFGGHVAPRVVRPHTIDARVRGAFVERASAPNVVGYAVPRASTPIRVPGTEPRYRTGSAGAAAGAALRAGAPTAERAPLGQRPGPGLSAPGESPRAVLRAQPGSRGDAASQRAVPSTGGVTRSVPGTREPGSSRVLQAARETPAYAGRPLQGGQAPVEGRQAPPTAVRRPSGDGQASPAYVGRPLQGRQAPVEGRQAPPTAVRRPSGDGQASPAYVGRPFQSRQAPVEGRQAPPTAVRRPSGDGQASPAYVGRPFQSRQAPPPAYGHSAPQQDRPSPGAYGRTPQAGREVSPPATRQAPGGSRADAPRAVPRGEGGAAPRGRGRGGA